MHSVETAPPPPDPASIVRSRQFLVLLVLASIVGVVVSVTAWGFLQLIHYTQVWVYNDLPQDLGYDSAPEWWSLPILAIAGIVTAFAIVRLPGRGGHVPARGLAGGLTQPIALPGVALAALASIGLGIVLGPEAPMIAIGSGLGMLTIRLVRRDAPAQVGELLATAGAFAGVSFLFGSPLIAAVILIEASGLGGPRMPLVLIPGLLAAGIGSLVSIGMGSWTGLSGANISLGTLPLPAFTRPDLVDFVWTIPLAVAVAVATVAFFRGGREIQRLAEWRMFLALPAIGLAVSGLAIAFSEATGKSVSDVLYSGQDQVAGLVSHAGSWSLSALGLLIAFKGVAYALSLGSFRGGPTFPAIFLGAAGGLMAAQLPGFSTTPAVAVCIGAAVVAALRLPLTAVVLATLFTFKAGLGAGPLIILAVAVAYVTTNLISAPPSAAETAGPGTSSTAQAPAAAAAGP